MRLEVSEEWLKSWATNWAVPEQAVKDLLQKKVEPKKKKSKAAPKVEV